MTERDDKTPDEATGTGAPRAPAPVCENFHAVLTPHRSLGPRGFVVLMSAVCAINFVMGIAFYLMGAWPVLGFCGLDVVLVYLAFKLNYRAGRAFETVELDPLGLRVTRVDPSGRSRSWDFNPYWVRLRLEGRMDDRTTLTLSSHGNELVIARALSNDERRAFATALQEALSLARASPR